MQERREREIPSQALFEKDRGYLLVVVDALDDVGEDVRNRQNREFVQIVILFQRNRVRYDHLFQRAGIDAVVGRPRKYGVRDGGPYAFGSARHQHVGCHADGTGCVDHVVDDQYVAAFDLADGRHFADDVRFGPLLMRDDDGRAEQFRIGVGPFRTAHVGGGNREVLDVEAPDIRHEDAAGIEGIDRYVEKSLYLIGMQIHRHDAVDAGGHQQIGDQLGADRHPRAVFAILTGPSEVGHHGYDLVGRCAAGGVYHHQQLHQIVRGRERRLDDEHRAAADGFVEAGLELSVAELQDFRLTEFGSETRGDLGGEVFGTATRENLDFVDGHRLRD